jgi:hypothetical protein
MGPIAGSLCDAEGRLNPHRASHYRPRRSPRAGPVQAPWGAPVAGVMWPTVKGRTNASPISLRCLGAGTGLTGPLLDSRLESRQLDIKDRALTSAG